MASALIEIQYLPSIAYFTALHKCDKIFLERHEYYVKQTYRNRCFINTQRGKEMLTIPLTSKHGKVFITDVRLDYSQKWLNNHWRAIQSAYGKAPFYEHYAEDLHHIMFKKFEFLYDLNYNLLSLCLKWLRWDTKILETSVYENKPESSIIDLRNTINAKKKPMMDNILPKSIAYTQVFGNIFVPHLSLIDLIFCEGSGSNTIIITSALED